MRFFSALALASSLLSASSVSAFVASEDTRLPRSPGSTAPKYDFNTRRQFGGPGSCNTPANRSCWAPGFNINTDYEASVPNTGVTRTYTLTISEEENWTGPDGEVKSMVMLVNGAVPGTQITADWGDMLSITVVNNLKTNGTSMHWHGIRQLNTNLQDGVNGVTECPIPPGGSRVYNFRAEQYGTSWYHSHFSAQYGNGVWGTILINGPASRPYDIDLGVFPISDYYYETADYLQEFTESNGPPPSDNVLFNGTNINPATGAGSYAKVSLTPGKRHRLRLINPSVENHFLLSLSGHNLTIIESDFVPVEPETVEYLFIAPGQRYDVTIDANQPVDNYWFNVTFPSSGGCGTSANPHPAAIFHYRGASCSNLPTAPGNAVSVSACSDLHDLKPVLKRTIPTDQFTASIDNILDVTLDINATASQLLTWKVNASSIRTDWNTPVDKYIFDNNHNYPITNNIVTVPPPENGSWTFWVIENDPLVPIPHPIHLHGHDFAVLATSDAGSAAFDASTVVLNGDNPPRRDVTMLPALGWIVIAFKADNPGAWLLHCHIAWHISGGLGVTFLEDPSSLARVTSAADRAGFDDNCKAWNDYYPSGDPYRQSDSGLRVRQLAPKVAVPFSS